MDNNSMWASAGVDCVKHSEEGGEAPYAGVFESEGQGLQFGLCGCGGFWDWVYLVEIQLLAFLESQEPREGRAS